MQTQAMMGKTPVMGRILQCEVVWTIDVFVLRDMHISLQILRILVLNLHPNIKLLVLLDRFCGTNLLPRRDLKHGRAS